MAERGPERRLAAIVAIDVVGYSRLMGADEKSTLRILKAHQDALTPMVQSRGGRVVNTAGDGFLLEFPSVIEALECAIEVQAAMAERNEDIPEDKKMLFRIGINVGDVLVHTDNDIFGDGVNVAARIEPLAPPGGICISRSARNQVRDKMDVNLEDMGEIEVKNIARPIRVFRVLKEGEVAAKPPRQTPKWQQYAAVAALLIAVVGGGAGLWWQAQPDFTPADPARMAYKVPAKPSIAVLPFDNLTGDQTQDYLGEGLSENIIAMLATIPDLFVIARNSTFTFKGKATKVQEVAEQLGVRYVLEGSIQKSGEKLRITAQLVDAINGRHLWAERYDRNMSALFDMQDDITSKILEEMHVQLILGEQARELNSYSGNPEIFRLLTQGRAHIVTFSPEGLSKAEELYSQALKINPDLPHALANMGVIHYMRVEIGVSQNVAKDHALARQYGEKALSIREVPYAHFLLALLDVEDRSYESALNHTTRLLELSPSSGDANANNGWTNIAAGKPAEGVEFMKLAMRYEPYYPQYIPIVMGHGLMMLERYDEAKKLARGLLAGNGPDIRAHPCAWAYLAAIAIFEGDQAKAEEYAKQALAVEPNASLTYFTYAPALRIVKDQDYVKRYLNALRKAGIPETPPSKTTPKSAKPSIAVLPFKFLGDTDKFEWVADGLAFDISQKLTGGTTLRVVGRANTGNYEGKSVSSKSTGEELGVDFVLTGAVRIESTRLRINVDLSRVSDGEQKWAKTFDGELSTQSIFDFQDQITQSVTAAISSGFGVIAKTTQERILNRPGMPLNSYECIISSYQFLQTLKEKIHLAARHCLEKLTREEKASSEILSQLAYMYIIEHNVGYNRNPDPLKRALEAAETAVRLDAGNQAAWLQLAQVKFYQHEWGEFVGASEKALQINPEEPMTIGTIGYLYGVAGHHDKAVRLMDKALQLIPHPPVWWRLVYSFPAQDKGDWKFVLEQSKLYDPPWLYWGYARRAAAYGHLDNAAAAQVEFKKLLELKPDFANNFRTEMQIWNVPETRTEAFVTGFKKAGIDIPDSTK